MPFCLPHLITRKLLHVGQDFFCHNNKLKRVSIYIIETLTHTIFYEVLPTIFQYHTNINLIPHTSHLMPHATHLIPHTSYHIPHTSFQTLRIHPCWRFFSFHNAFGADCNSFDNLRHIGQIQCSYLITGLMIIGFIIHF